MDKEVQTPPAAPASDAGPAAAASALLAQLGEEAFAATGGDVWRSGQPPREIPPAEESQQVSAPADANGAGSTPAPSKAVSVSEAEKVILSEFEPLLGKYESLAEAKRGLHELIQSKKAAEERATRAALLEAEQERVHLAANGKEPASPPEPDPTDELETLGLPKEPLVRAMEGVFRRTLMQMGQEEAARQTARVEADQAVIQEFPEYKEKHGELVAWLETEPQVKAQVLEAERAGYHRLAREFAWLRFNRSAAAKAEQNATAAAEEATRKKVEARADARTLPVTQDPNARLVKTEEQLAEERNLISAKEMERLVGLARAGYEAPLWRRAFGETLPKDVFPDA